MTGLEPATSRPPDACANQLRYIPPLCFFSFAGAKVHTICENHKFFMLFFLVASTKAVGFHPIPLSLKASHELNNNLVVL